MHTTRILLCSAIAALLLNSSGGAATTTTFFNISDQTGFQQSGIGGTAGNGIVFASPIYAFQPGNTVDFGTAIVTADSLDERFSQCPPNCLSNAGLGVYYIQGGVGGLNSAAFELFDATGLFAISLDFADCSPSASCQIAYRLLFTPGPNIDGIQFGFQGSDLTIVAPSAVPVPPAIILFVTLLSLGCLTVVPHRHAARSACT